MQQIKNNFFENYMEQLVQNIYFILFWNRSLFE